MNILLPDTEEKLISMLGAAYNKGVTDFMMFVDLNVDTIPTPAEMRELKDQAIKEIITVTTLINS